jgi:UDP-N-acetyl-D-mannosaminuronic acid dehydrogenase
MSRTATYMAAALYKTFVRGDLIATGARTAEMCKLTENSYRDVNIAFANELSIICKKHDINPWELISLANRHPRVDILQPGAGVGGHCIAVDPWFIVDSAPEEARIIRTAREVNDYKPLWVVEQVKAAIADVMAADNQKTMADITVACLGLAFKPDIDDLRESPALNITTQLSHLGCNVSAVEPNIEALPQGLDLPNLKLSPSLEEAIADADVVCVLVKHKGFISARGEIQNSSQIVDAVGLLG